MSPPMANRSNSVDFRVMLSLTEPACNLGTEQVRPSCRSGSTSLLSSGMTSGPLVAQDLSLASQRDVAALLQR
jgi:hypothetical protein